MVTQQTLDLRFESGFKTNFSRKALFALLSLLTAMLAKAAADSPDLELEARLAQIYAKNSNPVREEVWSQLVGSRREEVYHIQKGDTLWELSQTLFADGFYWSKLWAENGEIGNPHQISTGRVLKFISGNEVEAPSLSVLEEEADDDQEEIAPPIAEEEDSNVEPSKPVALKEPSKQSRPPQKLHAAVQLPTVKEKDVIEPLRSNNPEDLAPEDPEDLNVGAASRSQAYLNEAPYFAEDIEGKFSQSDIESGVIIEQSEIIKRPTLPPGSIRAKRSLSKLPKSFKENPPIVVVKQLEVKRKASLAESHPGAIVPSYLGFEDFEKNIEVTGEVIEVEAGDTVASVGQGVFFKSKQPLKQGQKVFTLTPRYKLNSPENGSIGQAYEVGGILQVIEPIKGAEGSYRAQVIYAVNPVRINSMVALGEPPRVAVTAKGNRNPGELLIVAGGLAADRRHFADESIIFLDRLNANVSVGDILSIQAKRKERRETEFTEVSKPVAMLRVFQVFGRVVTAIVVVATEEIKIGDRSGSEFPERSPELKFVAPRAESSAAGTVQ